MEEPTETYFAETADRIRVSPSRITAACDYETYREKVEGIRMPPSPAMIRGRAVGWSYSEQLRMRAAAGAAMSAAEVEAETRRALNYDWERGVYLGEGDNGDAYEETLAESLELAEAARTRLVPRTDPLSVEGWLTLDIGPVELVGRYDVVAREGKRTAVIDLKTSGQTPGEADLAGNVQTAFYAYLLDQQGEPVDTVGLDWIRPATKRTPARVWRLRAPAPQDYGPLLRRAEIVARMFETEDFAPVNPTSQVGKWKCTPRFCAHYFDCPFGRAARVQVAMEEL